jgi:acyl carrier protein
MSNQSDPLEVIEAAISKVAPDVDLASLPPDADLREEAELDSLDFLNVVTAVHESTGIEISERDYPRLATLSGFVDYLGERLSSS